MDSLGRGRPTRARTAPTLLVAGLASSFRPFWPGFSVAEDFHYLSTLYTILVATGVSLVATRRSTTTKTKLRHYAALTYSS